MNETEALLFFTHIPHFDSIKIRLLIQYYGSAVQAVQATAAELAEWPGFGPKILQSWEKRFDQGLWQQTASLAEKYTIDIIPYTHQCYPKRLLELIDFPLVLYVKGSLLPADQHSLAIIGTRQASPYGLRMAAIISAELAEAKFTVVSGLARGIDTIAHQAACDRGRTIAVLGSGLGHIYPLENLKLAEKIIQRGALVSEFPISMPPDRHQFLQRNRLLSGMTMGTILIEAPKDSGTMKTAERAISQGRKVFALPGPIDQESFGGNHALIKSKQAELIENSEDVIMSYSDLFTYSSFKPPVRYHSYLEQEETDFIQQLPAESLSIEEIINKTRLSPSKVNMLLMSLVLKKLMKEYPGKIYKKI